MARRNHVDPAQVFRLFYPRTLLAWTQNFDWRITGRWMFYSAIIGVLGALAALVFGELVNLLTRLILIEGAGYPVPFPRGEGGTDIFDLEQVLHPARRWLLLIAPAAGGLLAGWIVFTFAPEAEGHGTDSVIRAFHRERGFMRLRAALVKIVAAALTIGSGGSAGREGPITQIGATLGSWLAQRLRLSERERRLFLVAGMAAGLSSIFRSPLGGAFFAVEVLYREDIESEALMPAIVASITGYSLYTSIERSGTVFVTPRFEFVNPLELLPLIGFALCCAIVGIFYVRVFYGTKRRIFDPMPLPPALKPALGGLLVGAIAFFFPAIMGSSYGWLQQAIDGNLPLGFMALLARYASERPFTDAFFRRDELDPALGDVVFDDPQPGKVVGPVVAGGLAHLVKIRAVRPSEETVIRARHILIRAPEDNPEARQQARQEALELKRQLEQGADFATLAREHSDDPGSARRGGDLGWFGRGRMVEPFEEAAFSAPIGRVVGPVETRFGYHLIEVTGRSSVEVQIADLAMRPAPSLATLNRIQERMEDLAYYAEESGDFEGEAQRMGLQVQEMRVEEDQQFLPGIGQSRAVLNFLAGADEGDVSQVIELDDRFIVLQLVEVIPKGYRSFEEVREEIRPRVLLEKKKEVQVARMRRALQQHGFDGLAEALGTTVQTVTQLSYNQTLIPGLGREPRFVGTVFGLQEGETSGVVEGENAAFVVQLAKLYEPPPLGEQMREQIRQQLLNQRRQQVLTQWLAALREQADIKDYRRRFEL